MWTDRRNRVAHYLFPKETTPFGTDIVRRLAELGWVKGKNLITDCVSTIRLEELSTRSAKLVSRRLLMAQGRPRPALGSFRERAKPLMRLCLPRRPSCASRLAPLIGEPTSRSPRRGGASILNIALHDAALRPAETAESRTYGGAVSNGSTWDDPASAPVTKGAHASKVQ